MKILPVFTKAAEADGVVAQLEMHGIHAFVADDAPGGLGVPICVADEDFKRAMTAIGGQSCTRTPARRDKPTRPAHN